MAAFLAEGIRSDVEMTSAARVIDVEDRDRLNDRKLVGLKLANSM